MIDFSRDPWLQVDQLEQFSVAIRGWKYLQVVASGCKWLQVATVFSGDPWMQVDATGPYDRTPRNPKIMWRTLEATLEATNDLERSSVLLRLYYVTVAILAQGNTSG